MEVKDQIAARRAVLRMSRLDLADAMGVTEQAVRHWESGRSYPTKSKMAQLEQVLQCKLAWTGEVQGEAANAGDFFRREDIEAIQLLASLPAEDRQRYVELIRSHLDALGRGRHAA